jgi:hypothetical protein
MSTEPLSESMSDFSIEEDDEKKTVERNIRKTDYVIEPRHGASITGGFVSTTYYKLFGDQHNAELYKIARTRNLRSLYSCHVNPDIMFIIRSEDGNDLFSKPMRNCKFTECGVCTRIIETDCKYTHCAHPLSYQIRCYLCGHLACDNDCSKHGRRIKRRYTHSYYHEKEQNNKKRTCKSKNPVYKCYCCGYLIKAHMYKCHLAHCSKRESYVSDHMIKKCIPKQKPHDPRCCEDCYYEDGVLLDETDPYNMPQWVKNTNVFRYINGKCYHTKFGTGVGKLVTKLEDFELAEILCNGSIHPDIKLLYLIIRNMRPEDEIANNIELMSQPRKILERLYHVRNPEELKNKRLQSTFTF